MEKTIKHFETEHDFYDFINGGSKNGIYTSEMTQILDRLNNTADAYEGMLTKLGATLTGIDFENGETWQFTLIYTLADGSEERIVQEENI